MTHYGIHSPNTETSSEQAAIFGRPLRSFSFWKGQTKIKLVVKL